MINATSRPLYLQERPGTLCRWGWMDPRAGLDGCGKIASTGIRYTDWAIQAHSGSVVTKQKVTFRDVLYSAMHLTPTCRWLAFTSSGCKCQQHSSAFGAKWIYRFSLVLLLPALTQEGEIETWIEVRNFLLEVFIVPRVYYYYCCPVIINTLLFKASLTL